MVLFAITIAGIFQMLSQSFKTAESARDLNRVTRVVKVLGMVNSEPDFTGQSQVMNGASFFLQEIFGDAGHHARSAVGMASLPVNFTVEIEIIFEIEGN